MAKKLYDTDNSNVEAYKSALNSYNSNKVSQVSGTNDTSLNSSASASSNSLSDNSNSSNWSSSSQDYLDMLNRQDYSSLLDSELQLEKSKQNALKYTRNSINANGFGGTGYGSSVNSSIQNAYANALGKARTEYSNNIEKNNQSVSSDEFNSISTNISNATDLTTLDNYLTNMGVMQNGSLVKPSYMTDSDFANLSYLYENQKNAINSTTPESASYSLSTLKDLNYENRNGNAQYTINEGFANELNYINANIVNQKITPGTSMKVSNGYGDTIYLEYTSNGTFRVINEDLYNSSTSKKEITKK